MHAKSNLSKPQEDAAKSQEVRVCEGLGERDGEETEATERDKTEHEEGQIEVRKVLLRTRAKSNYTDLISTDKPSYHRFLKCDFTPLIEEYKAARDCGTVYAFIEEKRRLKEDIMKVGLSYHP